MVRTKRAPLGWKEWKLTPARNQYHGRSKYYSQYLQLAVSIAVDMRLDRKPIRSKEKSYGNKRDPLVAGSPGTQTWGPEEQRAAAGIFYISSTYVVCVGFLAVEVTANKKQNI